MFSVKELPASWKKPDKMITLLIHFVYKLVFTACSVSLPLPVGVTTPILATGALLGRWYGELMRMVFPWVVPAPYAVMGAAGFAAGATRTVSTALLVFELTGQLHYMVPILLVTLISYAVASTMSVSIYDFLIQVKGFPYVPTLELKNYSKTALDVMQKPPLHVLTFESTYADVENVLKSSAYYQIPIVKDKESMAIWGAVQRSVLQKLLDSMFAQDEYSFEPPAVANSTDIAGMNSSSRQAIPENLLSGPQALAWNMEKIDSDSEGKEASVLGEPEQNEDEASDQVSVMPKFAAREPKILVNRVSSLGAFEPEELAAHQAITVADLKLRKIDFSQVSKYIDESPLQIVPRTSLPKIHFIFTMLGVGQVLVSSEGRLVGIVTRADLGTTFIAKGTLDFNVDT
jgi:chloride channel 2